MKLAFLLLVLANVVLYAWQHGVFGRYAERGREPERVERQIEADRFRVLREDEVRQLRARSEEPRAAAPGNPAPNCVEYGDFAASDAARADIALAALGLKPIARSVELPGYWLVYLAPAKTRADADRRAAELRRLGVADLLVVTDDSPLRYGIRLGAFRDAEAARVHLTSLQKLGVDDARVSERPTTQVATRFQLRELSSDARAQLAALKKDFPAQTLRGC
jgi:hypothetical protein